MKTLSFIQLICFLIALPFFPISATANNNNPQIRICRQLGGTFFVARSADDEIGFCQFDASVIGALDLMDFKNQNQKLHSIENYENFVPRCSPWGQPETLTVTDNEILHVCHYADDSRIGVATLEAGRLSEENKKFNRALNF